MAGPGRLNFSVLVDDKSVGRYLTYGDADGSDTSPSALLRGAALWAIRATRSHWITGWGDKTSGVWTHSGVRMTSQSTVTAARCELRLLATNTHTRKRPTSADEHPCIMHHEQPCLTTARISRPTDCTMIETRPQHRTIPDQKHRCTPPATLLLLHQQCKRTTQKWLLNGTQTVKYVQNAGQPATPSTRPRR